jgi:Terpene synthase family 2, C-terminal metal binding
MTPALDASARQGKVCATAMECLRDLEKCAAAYPDLYPGGPFGTTVFSGIALAMAFGSPRAPAERIRVVSRTVIWAFAVDWLLDRVATSREEVDAVAGGCEAVAAGAAPEGSLQEFLASIRDELAARPDWAEQRPVWLAHLRAYLRANVREWEWKARDQVPTFEEYLANADNIGSSFVNVTHWIHTGTPEPGRLEAANAECQRALRLLNDLATYERDVAWGDLNVLLLGLSRSDVAKRADELVRSCEDLLEPLAATLPEETGYLRRQLGFSVGYYGITDYWGEL